MKHGIGATSGGAPRADMKMPATVLPGAASAARRTAPATSASFVTSGGMKMTRTESTRSSPSSTPSARSYCSAVADAIMSTGLPTDAAAGRNDRSAATVASDSGGTTRPCASHASAARMPGPPALVRIATRRPRGTGWWARSVATSNSSSSVFVRMMPACRNSASTIASLEASAPVCDAAARAPAADRPALTAMIGLRRATRRAIRLKCARVAEALEVEEDRPRCAVLAPVLPAGRCSRRRRLLPDGDRTWTCRCRSRRA